MYIIQIRPCVRGFNRTVPFSCLRSLRRSSTEGSKAPHILQADVAASNCLPVVLSDQETMVLVFETRSCTEYLETKERNKLDEAVI